MFIGLRCATLRLWDGDWAPMGVECRSHSATDTPIENYGQRSERLTLYRP